jgi:hypothetical protein
MIMPYGVKDTGVQPGQGPSKINFDILWQKAFAPLIRELGYEPVRADQDIGALIIHEMLERLYFSDLVLADMTLPNGNVYYEVGVRHAAREKGCVLIGADWSRSLFDVDQMRLIRYPLPDVETTDQTAENIKACLRSFIPKLAGGDSPMVQALPGFPGNVDPNRATTIKNILQELAQFQAKTQIALMAPKSEKTMRVENLLKEYPPSQTKNQSVALGMVRLLEDSGGWQALLDYVDALPAETRDIPVIEEQHCLAMSKIGNHLMRLPLSRRLSE